MKIGAPITWGALCGAPLTRCHCRHLALTFFFCLLKTPKKNGGLDKIFNLLIPCLKSYRCQVGNLPENGKAPKCGQICNVLSKIGMRAGVAVNPNKTKNINSEIVQT